MFSNKTPAREDLFCANYSNDEWEISIDSGKLVFSKQIPPSAFSKKRWEAYSESGKAAIEKEFARRFIPKIEYEGGTIVGINRGEFGGGLWWHEGDTKTKISDERVHGFLRTEFGTLAFVGLDHMGMRSGQVLVFSRSSTGPPGTTVLADLGESPHAFALAPDGSVVLVTSTKIHRIKSPGVIETIHNATYSPLYPTSVVALRSGEIYVGMRHFVTRLMPKGSLYEEEWLVPTDCLSFVKQDYRCVCLGRQP